MGERSESEGAGGPAAGSRSPTPAKPAPDDPKPIERGFLSRAVRAVGARRWILAAAAIVGAGAGLIGLLSGAGEYQARALISVAPLGPGPSAAEFRRATAERLVDDPGVAVEAAGRLRVAGIGAGELDEKVETRERAGTLIEVEARDNDRERATDIAEAYAGALNAAIRAAERQRIAAAIRQLESELDDLAGADERLASIEARIGELTAERATVAAQIAPVGEPETSSQSLLSTAALYLAGGLGGALALGVLLALGLEGIDRRLRTPEDLERVYRLPVLTRVPRSRRLGGGSRLTSGASLGAVSGFSREAEAFRTLRANLRYFGSRGGIGSLLVVSPLAGEGKSTTTRLLAVTMAAMGDNVCLVDADLRKGDLSAAEADPRPEGLSMVLAGFDLDEALIEVPAAVDPVTARSRVLVELRSGALPPNPSELLEGERMQWLLEELGRRFDTVIIDSPALASVSDALSLVGRVSGVLIVSALDRTTRNSALGLRNQLAMLGARQVGVVANYWRPDRELAYDYGGRARSTADRVPQAT